MWYTLHTPFHYIRMHVLFCKAAHLCASLPCTSIPSEQLALLKHQRCHTWELMMLPDYGFCRNTSFNQFILISCVTWFSDCRWQGWVCNQTWSYLIRISTIRLFSLHISPYYWLSWFLVLLVHTYMYICIYILTINWIPAIPWIYYDALLTLHRRSCLAIHYC